MSHLGKTLAWSDNVHVLMLVNLIDLENVIDGSSFLNLRNNKLLQFHLRTRDILAFAAIKL